MRNDTIFHSKGNLKTRSCEQYARTINRIEDQQNFGVVAGYSPRCLQVTVPSIFIIYNILKK